MGSSPQTLGGRLIGMADALRVIDPSEVDPLNLAGELQAIGEEVARIPAEVMAEVMRSTPWPGRTTTCVIVSKHDPNAARWNVSGRFERDAAIDAARTGLKRRPGMAIVYVWGRGGRSDGTLQPTGPAVWYGVSGEHAASAYYDGYDVVDPVRVERVEVQG